KIVKTTTHHPEDNADKTLTAKSQDVPNMPESCKADSSRESVEVIETKADELKGIFSKPSWLEAGRYVPPQKRLCLPREENVLKGVKSSVCLKGEGVATSTIKTDNNTEEAGLVEAKTENKAVDTPGSSGEESDDDEDFALFFRKKN
ncbi:hypothetical protein M758_UG223000, partial [Ceratodon purpureus]